MKNKYDMPYWKKVIVRSMLAILLMFTCVFYQSCSKDEDNSEPTDQHTVELGNNDNMPSAGKITSQYSDSPQGYDVSKMVDNDTSTSFTTPYSSFYIIWAGSKSAAVNSYSIASSNGSASDDPKSWKLYGSRDSKNWILLDVQSNQMFEEREEALRYTFTNTTRFNYFKLEILSNNGGKNTQIAEWYMREPNMDYDISLLIDAYSSGHTNSLITPMGKKFEKGAETTQDIIDWLLNPANEPAIPTGVLESHKVTLYPFGKPSPADCNQNKFNDCGAVAGLASMAYQNPNFVESLIQDHGDNTYTVSMFDPKGKPVKVRVSNKFATSGSTIVALRGKNNTATWGTVLEKAIMKYNEKYKVTGIEGIATEIVPTLFTGNGNSFAFKPGLLSNEELTKVITVSILEGKFVFGGFKKAGLPVSGTTTHTMHVYTLMHTANDGAIFTMRNPWGNQNPNGKEDGLVNIPNNNTIPPIIDLRIVEPGLSGTNGTTEKYTPPSL